MASLRSKVASALSFAHLASVTGRARAEDDDKDKKPDAENPDDDKDDKGTKRAEDDERKQRDGESDDDYAKRMKALDEEEDSGDEDDKQDKAADDDADAEMRGNSPAAAARRRERARCAAIFASKAAGRNPALAANLAFNTSMSRTEALAVLENTPAPQQAAPGRAARNPNLGGGGQMERNSAEAVVSRMADRLQKASCRK